MSNHPPWLKDSNNVITFETRHTFSTFCNFKNQTWILKLCGDEKIYKFAPIFVKMAANYSTAWGYSEKEIVCTLWNVKLRGNDVRKVNWHRLNCELWHFDLKVIHARPNHEIEVKMAFSLFLKRKVEILSFKCFFPFKSDFGLGNGAQLKWNTTCKI